MLKWKFQWIWRLRNFCFGQRAIIKMQCSVGWIETWRNSMEKPHSKFQKEKCSCVDDKIGWICCLKVNTIQLWLLCIWISIVKFNWIFKHDVQEHYILLRKDVLHSLKNISSMCVGRCDVWNRFNQIEPILVTFWCTAAACAGVYFSFFL